MRRTGPISPIGLIGLIGLIGCSSDPATDTLVPEPVPAEEKVTDTPIVFSDSLQDEQTVTRASLPLSGKATTFTVYGYKNMSAEGGSYDAPQRVFPGYVVNWVANTAGSSTTNTNGWEYVNQQPLGQAEQTIKYWDWSAKAYRFFAVTGEASGSIDGDVYKMVITVDGTSEASAAATPFFSHLWFSNGSLSDYPNRQFGKPVQLEFLKPLAKVRFKFVFENPDDAKSTTLTEKSFRPTSGTIIGTSAQITISYPLSGKATQETYAISSVPGGIEEFGQDYYETVTKETINGVEHVISPYYDALESECNKEYVVLPATNQGTYALTVSVNGEPKTTVVPAEFMDWKIGYLYTYIFKVHVDYSVSIDVVQSAFTMWSTDIEKDHTVYNW